MSIGSSSFLMEVIKTELFNARDQKLNVRVEVITHSFDIGFYQDKIGTGQYIELYQNNTDGRYGYLIMSVFNQSDSSACGKFNINITSLDSVSIFNNGSVCKIIIDDLLSIQIFY